MLAVFAPTENIIIISLWVSTHVIHHHSIIHSNQRVNEYPNYLLLYAHLKVDNQDFHIYTNCNHGLKRVSVIVVVQEEYGTIEVHDVLMKPV